MRRLQCLKEVIKLRNGLIFSLKLLSQTFLIGILFSALCEFVFLFFIRLLGLNIDLSTDVFMTILGASFLTFIFSRQNILNHLFINGFSRKDILKIKTWSSLIYVGIFFLIFFIYEIIWGALISNFLNFDTILRLIVAYLSVSFFVEFATFLDLLYKNISIKKGKGVNKTLYKYAYSIPIIIFTYVYRLIYPNIRGYYTSVFLLLSIAVIFTLQYVLALTNHKWILSMDIRA